MVKIKKLHFGYYILAGVALLQFLFGMALNTTGMFYVPVSQEFDIPLSVFGMYPTIMTFLQAVMLIPIGRFFSRSSTRLSITCAVLCYAASCALRGTAGSMQMFFLSAPFQAFGNAIFAFIIAPVLIQNWFNTHQGLALGICSACQGVGAAFFSLVGGRVMTVYGWHTCYYIQAAAFLIAGLPITLFLLRKRPEEMGFLPVGYSAGNPSQNVNDTEIDIARTLRSLPCIMILILASLWAFVTAFLDYLNPYTTSLAYTTQQAAAVTAAGMAGIMVGRLGNGLICDNKGIAADLMSILSAALCSVIILIKFAPEYYPALLPAAFLFGWVYGGLSIVAPLLVRRTFGINGFRKIWIYICIGESLVGASGYSLWGIVVERAGYTGALIAVVTLMTCVILAGLYVLRRKNMQKRRDHVPFLVSESHSK